MKPAISHCAECGAAIPSGQPSGLCARCALEGVLELDGGDPEAASALDAGESSERAATQRPPVPLPAAATEGARFGDYELLGEIARGGMGVVHRARQISLHRMVALKMIASRQLDSPTAIQRFRTEAEAAANLDHPNIVPIHEIGEHAGQHFFTMKLVEGRSLAQRMSDFRLPSTESSPSRAASSAAFKSELAARSSQVARLMAQIADAVHYAHQRGILHRDLKPGNILIDAAGQPHVTDFGLAKRVESDSDLTASGDVMGTPAYMAPEQAAGQMRQMTTAADVYSLGVMLYELLIGRVPFRGATPLETLALVRHTEPTAPRTLNPAAPRDLETICLKCLEKEPGKRFASAHDLAAELHRFLRDEPIHARPVSQPERLWRWCRRKPALAGLAASAVLLPLVVTVVSLIAASHIATARDAEKAQRSRAETALTNEARLRVQAESEEKNARREAKKSAQVVAFLEDMLKGVGPARARGRDTAMLREILDKTAERVSRDLKDQPHVEAEVRSMLGNVYQQLDEYKSAEAMKRTALDLWKQSHGEESLGVASALNNLAVTLTALGQLAEAETLYREALAMKKRLPGGEDRVLANIVNNLGALLTHQKKLPEAEATHREALEIRKRVHGPEHPDIAQSLNSLAIVVDRQGRSAEAETLCRQALALDRKLFTNNHPALANSMHTLGRVLQRLRQWDEAETLLRQALTMQRNVLEGDRKDVAEALNSLGDLLADRGRFAEAEPFHRDALAMNRKLSDADDHAVTDSLIDLASDYSQQRKTAEAVAMLREALDLKRKNKGADSRVVLTLMNNLAETLQREGNYHEAASLLQELRSILMKQPEPDRRLLSTCLNNLAGLFRLQGKLTEAETMFRESVTIRRQAVGHDDAELARTLGSLAKVLELQDRLADAEPLRHESLAIQRKLLPPDHPHLLISLNNLAVLHSKRGNAAEAEARYREVVALTQKPPAREFPSGATARHNLASLLQGQGKLAEAESLFREELELDRKRYGNESWEASDVLINILSVLFQQQKTADAVPLARECLAIRTKLKPDHHHTLYARSFLGVSLLNDKAYAEAEQVLRSTYEAMNQRAKEIAAEQLHAVLNSLVKLYEAQNNTAEAVQWRKTLEEFDKAKPAARPKSDEKRKAE